MRALGLLRALVLLCVFLGITNASAGYTNNPAWTIPNVCTDVARLGRMLKYIQDDPKNPQDEGYICVVNADGTAEYRDKPFTVVKNQATYFVDSSYMRYVIAELIQGAYKGGSLPDNAVSSGSMSTNNDLSMCWTQTGFQQLGLVSKDSQQYSYGYNGQGWEITPLGDTPYGVIQNSGKTYSTQSDHQAHFKNFLKAIAKLSDAYSGANRCWVQDGIIVKMRDAMTNGYRQVTAEGYPDRGGETETPGSGDNGTTPTTPGTGTTNPAPNVTVNTPPPCTLSNGKVSGNPYDCAPQDDESKCSIIDIPCNLKRAFVPSPDFFKTGLNEHMNKRLILPVRVVSEISMETGNPMFPKIGIDFNGISNPTTTSILKLIAWFQVAFWILNYLGFPNPFGGSRRGDGYVSSAVTSAYNDSIAAQSAANDAIDANYARLRADDSWKRD